MYIESTGLEERDLFVCSLEDEDHSLPELYEKVPALKAIATDLSEYICPDVVVYEERSLLPLLSQNPIEINDFILTTVGRVLGGDTAVMLDTVDHSFYGGDVVYLTVDVIDPSGRHLRFTYVTVYSLVRSLLLDGRRGILRKQ